MFNVYPIIKTDLVTEDYQVKINGVEVGLNTARVSAVPFNRRWPGHQRGLEQTELINFISLSTNEPLTFEITPKADFETAVIRPRTLEISPIIENKTIIFTVENPAYFTVEPFGRNNALHIFIDPVKNYDVDFNDKNILYYGKGIHEVGQINLKDGQTLFIDEGAVVYACIKGFDVDNIRILGRGILDNSHNKAQILFEANEEGNYSAVNNAKRQHTVQLEYCNNIEIDGITIRDSLLYNVRPIACKNLHISNLKIIGCWRYNSDGIDMHNCEDVLIENCFLRTFDDSICVKGFDCYYEGDVEKAVYEAMHYGGNEYLNFKNVIVKNCIIWNDWGKSLEIGAETRADEICNILFTDSNIIHVTGAALDCYNVDYAHVHDITYRNISVEYDEVIPNPLIQKNDSETYNMAKLDSNPPVCAASVSFHPEYSAGGTKRGINEKILFENIHLYSNKKPNFAFSGYDKTYTTKNVTIRDFYLNDKKIEKEDEYVLWINDNCSDIKLI